MVPGPEDEPVLYLTGGSDGLQRPGTEESTLDRLMAEDMRDNSRKKPPYAPHARTGRLYLGAGRSR